MQSDTPQGDPRLQRTNPGPKVATGYVDPCIVYFETTAPGEIPLLGACWAASSREGRDAGGNSFWELKDVILVKGLYDRTSHNGKPHWSFTTRMTESLILKHDRTNALQVNSSYFTCRFELAQVSIPQWAFRFLTRETDNSLRKTLAEQSSYSDAMIKMVLEQSKLDWPSIAEAIASFKPLKPRPYRPSFLRRLISSVFKKKPKPVAA